MGKVWPLGPGSLGPKALGLQGGSLRGWSRNTLNRGLWPPLRLPPEKVLLDYLDGGEGGGAAGNTWIYMVLFFLKRQKTPLSDLPWPRPEQGKERKIFPFPSPGEEKGPREGRKWPEITEQDRPPTSLALSPPGGLAGFSVWAAASELPVPFLRGELGPVCPPQPVLGLDG